MSFLPWCPMCSLVICQQLCVVSICWHSLCLLLYGLCGLSMLKQLKQHAHQPFCTYFCSTMDFRIGTRNIPCHILHMTLHVAQWIAQTAALYPCLLTFILFLTVSHAYYIFSIPFPFFCINILKNHSWAVSALNKSLICLLLAFIVHYIDGYNELIYWDPWIEQNSVEY